MVCVDKYMYMYMYGGGICMCAIMVAHAMYT